MDLKKIIAQALKEYADSIEADTCGITNDELETLAKQILHIELNKTEASKFLNMSTRTFDRRIDNGDIPVGIKNPGTNQLIWYKDELCLAK